MALKDKWVDKQDDVDINSAEDINQVARAVIELEKYNEENKIPFPITNEEIDEICV